MKKVCMAILAIFLVSIIALNVMNRQVSAEELPTAVAVPKEATLTIPTREQDHRDYVGVFHVTFSNPTDNEITLNGMPYIHPEIYGVLRFIDGGIWTPPYPTIPPHSSTTFRFDLRVFYYAKPGRYEYDLIWDITEAGAHYQILTDPILYLNEETAVGGIIIPIDKLALLAPYIGLASTTIIATVAAAIYVKRVKRRKEKP